MNRRLLLPALLALVVIVGGWYFLLWEPGQSRLHAADTAVAKAASAHVQLVSELGGLKALQRQLPADEAALRLSQPALPTAPDLTTAIDQMAQAARSAGVAWTNESQALAPASTASSGSATSAVPGTSSVALTLRVTGSYQQVTSFVRMLAERPRLVIIDTLELSPSARAVQATIDARAFYDTTPVPDLAGLAARR